MISGPNIEGLSSLVKVKKNGPATRAGSRNKKTGAENVV